MALNDRYCAATKCRLLGEKRKSLVHANYVNDPNVWSGRALQENFVELAESGLASMYPAFCWSVGSWPSWISARVRSHYRKGLNGPFGSPVFASAGKTEPPSRLILSQTSADIES